MKARRFFLSLAGLFALALFGFGLAANAPGGSSAPSAPVSASGALDLGAIRCCVSPLGNSTAIGEARATGQVGSSRLAGTGTPAPSAVPTCPPAWAVLASPNGSTSRNELWGVGAVSDSDAWAVGLYYMQPSGTHVPLIERWNGTQWNIASGAPITSSAELHALTVLAPDNVWAVGSYSTLSGSLVEHWDGSAWSIVQSPAPGAGYNNLAAISAAGPDDIWAVGVKGPYNAGSPLVIHWDGTAWANVNLSGIPGVYSEFYGVAALASNNVWAVGYYNTSDGHKRTLTAHWDGMAWGVIPSPNYGTNNADALISVGGAAANDVWAVGELDYGVSALIEHWDGSAWSITTTLSNGSLRSVLPISADNVWAVGTRGENQTLSMYWDGASWSVVPASNPNPNYNAFKWIAMLPSGALWGVGYQGGPYEENRQTLIELYSTLCLPDVTPTNTSTPASTAILTVTGTPPTPVCTVATSTPYPTSTEYSCWYCGLCQLPTPTPYPTSTPYPCPLCPTMTPTHTDTPTLTPTWTLTPTQTNTPTSTPTFSGQCTLQTVTPNPTYTPRPPPPTVTPCFQSTYAPQPTYTPNPTYTPTQCPGAPCSPTITPTPTRTPTITDTPTNTPTATPTCTGVWGVVQSPNPGTASVFSGVDAVSPSNVWAVGSYNGSTLTEHWDGTQWRQVNSPNPGSGSNILKGVDTLAPDNIWAVGWYQGFNGHYTLTEHWDGTQWNVVPSPNPVNSIEHYLLGVSAASTSDVWAVGYYYADNGWSRTLIEHWDGNQWSIVPSPNGSPYNNQLEGVSAISANDAWAVGGYMGNGSLTLVEHWDGSQWMVVSNPNPPGSNAGLAAVGAISGEDIWAVGSYSLGAGNSNTLTEHWDGNQWSIVPSPNADPQWNALQAVAAIASGDVWAVGESAQNQGATLTEHWDGQHWSIVPSPNPGTGENQLWAVTAVSYAEVWAVGYWGFSNESTITEHYAADCPTPPPAPSDTPPPTSIASSTATATVTLPAVDTLTATPTATVCPIQFIDVPPGSTFYSFIRCLACLGIINGYPDSTFRPNNHVTRGQLSKIVSNSAGFSDPQPDQLFQDVPVGSTFQVYIGRLASRGYINGYPCGGSNEACSPGNLPYFRPNNNATRGQISKIVSNAAGYSDPPSGQQFQDVPVGSTFYSCTYRLATRNVIQGYPCGGPGEPCAPPANLPYFRPGNNATRGQTSKIVSNTFFPDCSPRQ